MNDELPADGERPSKSARKRAGQALQQLAETLLALPQSHLAEIPLGEPLRKALADSRAITQHEARRRQLQYLGKLMRDADTDAILAALAEREQRGRHFRRHHERIDGLCEQLCTGGDAALTALLAEHPSLERQPLRQLVRNAAGDADPRSAARRKLFDYLRVHLSRTE